MSTSEEIEIKCPGCGAQQVTKVWKTLDASVDASIRDALFAWEINVFHCSARDFKAQMPVGLLYNDPVKQFAIQFYPVDAMGSDEFYEGFTRNGELLATGDADKQSPELQRLKPHIVFDMAEMMRYIVFREIVFQKGK